MMTYEEMMEVIEALGEDVEVDIIGETIYVTIQDFEGFDSHWCEIERELTNEEAVEAFEEMLEAECLSEEGDFYTFYYFEGFRVRLGYASADI